MYLQNHVWCGQNARAVNLPATHKQNTYSQNFPANIMFFSFYLSERLVHPLENVPRDPLVEEDPLGVGHVLLQLEERLLALLRLGHLLRGEEALQRGRVVGELFSKRGNGVRGGGLFFSGKGGGRRTFAPRAKCAFTYCAVSTKNCMRQ